MSDSKRLGDVVFFGNDVWFWQKINSFSVLCTNIFVWDMVQNFFYFCNGWKKDAGEGVVSRKIHLNQNCCPQGCLNLCQVSTFVSGVSALWTLFILWHLQACHNFSYREEAHKTNEISHKTLSISLLKAKPTFSSQNVFFIFWEEIIVVWGILTVHIFHSFSLNHNWDL